MQTRDSEADEDFVTRRINRMSRNELFHEYVTLATKLAARVFILAGLLRRGHYCNCLENC